MTFLPIVDRELRVAARRPVTHRVRLFAAMAVIGFGFVTLASARSGAPPHQVGKTIFVLETVVAFAFCLLSGVFLTADCLSVEKREGTLGLLFLTDLRGSDVVLGKLAATSLQSVYGILAIFPMLGLPLLMGGVSRGEFARVLLALLLDLVFSLAIGLLLSALGRETRQTMAATFGILVVFAGLLPALAWLEHIYAGGGTVVGTWFLASPVGALMLAFDWSYRTSQGAGMFWTSVGILTVLSLGALVFAGLILPRAFRLEKSYSVREGRNFVSQRTRFGGGRGAVGRRLKLEKNPFYWLATRDRLVRLITWVAILFPGVLWLCFIGGGLKVGPRRHESFALSFMVAFALHAIFKAIVALEASRRLSEDNHSGALELLLATPLPPRMILRGQWLALQDHFIKPMVALLLVNATLLWLAERADDPMNVGDHERNTFRTMFVGGAVALWLDFRALSWTGMLLALRSKSHSRAVLSTLGRVMLLPWAGIFAFVIIGEIGRGLSGAAVGTFVFIWFLVGAILSLTAAAKAKRQLADDFRRLATGVNEKPLIASRSGLWLWRGQAVNPVRL